MTRVLESPAELGAFKGCLLVPTMGALHDGHASLIRAARHSTERSGRDDAALPPVLVTIFVNPTQFGPNEDFARYPRTLEADLRLAHDAGADAAFVPSVDAIYPRGLDAARHEAVAWDLPPAATEPGLEDRCRPGHLGGVCLVVARLFALCEPSRAFFGEKDWQQLRVISQMVEMERRLSAASRRFGDLEIARCPTVREHDGLAMSSRNRFLGAEERRRATALWRAIELARSTEGIASSQWAMRAGAIDRAEASMLQLIESEGFLVDYAAIRDEATLCPGHDGITPHGLRILLAARLGGVRLIDNAPLRS